MKNKGFFIILLCTGCITLTPKFKGDVWLHDSIPPELCMRYPDIQDFGIYRKLNDGSMEFIPYCDDEIKNYLSSHAKDVEIGSTKE